MGEGRELSFLLEEYRALRAEISASLAAQHAALSYGVAAVALLAVAIASAWDKSPALTAIALMAVVPIAIFLIFTIWGTEIGRMKRAGSYIGEYLEPRINQLALVDNALVWEGWLAKKIQPPKPLSPWRRVTHIVLITKMRKSRTLNLGVGLIAVMLFILTVVAFAVGAYRFDQRAHLAVHTASAKTKVLKMSPRCISHPKLAACKPVRASWYYRNWRLPAWPNVSQKFWRRWEFYGFLGAFVALPLYYGLLLVIQNRRPFPLEELPQYEQRQALPAS